MTIRCENIKKSSADIKLSCSLFSFHCNSVIHDSTRSSHLIRAKSLKLKNNFAFLCTIFSPLISSSKSDKTYFSNFKYVFSNWISWPLRYKVWNFRIMITAHHSSDLKKMTCAVNLAKYTCSMISTKKIGSGKVSWKFHTSVLRPRFSLLCMYTGTRMVG